jgi:hypothetical protein
MAPFFGFFFYLGGSNTRGDRIHVFLI